jgi:mono/diheme cytochrome c family protein
VKARARRLAAAALAGLAAPGAATAGSPQVLYLLHCQGCHLADGSGKPGAVPALADVGRFLEVPGGRAYLVQVPGSAHSPLSDAELAAVLNWIVAAFGPERDARALRPYDADEVARYRATPLVDVAGARAELVRRIAPASARAPE